MPIGNPWFLLPSGGMELRICDEKSDRDIGGVNGRDRSVVLWLKPAHLWLKALQRCMHEVLGRLSLSGCVRAILSFLSMVLALFPAQVVSPTDPLLMNLPNDCSTACPGR